MHMLLLVSLATRVMVGLRSIMVNGSCLCTQGATFKTFVFVYVSFVITLLMLGIRGTSSYHLTLNFGV